MWWLRQPRISNTQIYFSIYSKKQSSPDFYCIFLLGGVETRKIKRRNWNSCCHFQAQDQDQQLSSSSCSFHLDSPMLSHPSLLVFVVYLVNCSHFNPGCSVLLVITFFLGKSGCTCPGSNTNGPQGNMRSPGVDQLMAHTFLFALTVIQHTPPSSC